MFIRDVPFYTFSCSLFNSNYWNGCYSSCEQDEWGRFSEMGQEEFFVLLLGA